MKTFRRLHIIALCSVAVLIAAMAAKGVTEIENIEHVERGYEDIVGKLSALGANIRKVVIPDHVLKAVL